MTCVILTVFISWTHFYSFSTCSRSGVSNLFHSDLTCLFCPHFSQGVFCTREVFFNQWLLFLFYPKSCLQCKTVSLAFMLNMLSLWQWLLQRSGSSGSLLHINSRSQTPSRLYAITQKLAIIMKLVIFSTENLINTWMTQANCTWNSRILKKLNYTIHSTFTWLMNKCHNIIKHIHRSLSSVKLYYTLCEFTPTEII